MKMPNSREISDEQEMIYIEAPVEGTIMVGGPPGTGKTVIAFLRAGILSKKKKRVQVLMFNNVLKKYTENIAADDEGRIQSGTLNSWLPAWWEQNQIESEARFGEKVYLEISYDRKDEVKELGAKWDPRHWDPKRRKSGQWWVPIETLNVKEEALTPYLAKDFSIPKLDEHVFDYRRMIEGAAQHLAEGAPFTDWGHLIIDEAQDFSENLFSFLRFISSQLKDSGLTILADENQRLNEDTNSDIKGIMKALAIDEGRYYLLTENFRNTKEIASLAAAFYVGLPTGKPKTPSRRGEKPRLLRARSFEQQVGYIISTLKDRGYGEVGVFAQNEPMRERLFNKLSHQLRGVYRVQTYSSKTRKEHPVDELVFDKEGTVTVINRQSCKGLEFDAVFIPELQSVSIDGSNLDAFKMNMYVMCSRARTSLHLLYSRGQGQEPEFLQYFPPQDAGLLEYLDG